MRFPTALLAATIFLLSGCASSRPSKAGADQAAMAQAMRTVADFRGGSYKLGAGDLVSLTVYPDAQLGRKARVDADGTVSLPLIAPVPVAGKTIVEAQRAIEDKLGAFLVSPHVALVVEEYGNRQMFVLGEVRSPGSYAIPAGSRMTALQAVSTAGGFTKVAQPRRAHVLRYVNGKSVEQVIDLKAIARGGAADKDVILEPNDVIYIPKSVF
jgi:protein involved in polysaccharide export with SLBB domain